MDGRWWRWSRASSESLPLPATPRRFRKNRTCIECGHGWPRLALGQSSRLKLAALPRRAAIPDESQKQMALPTRFELVFPP